MTMTRNARVFSIVAAGLLGLAALSGVTSMKREQAGTAYAGPASDCGFCRCEPCRQPDASRERREIVQNIVVTPVSLSGLTNASVATGLMRSVW